MFFLPVRNLNKDFMICWARPHFTEVDIDIFLSSSAESFNLAVLAAFMRRGLSLRTVGCFTDFFSLIHTGSRWRGEDYKKITGWFFLHSSFVQFVPIFDYKFIVLPRKAGSKRRHYFWWLKYLPENERNLCFSRWIDVFHSYFLFEFWNERLASVFCYLYYNLKENEVLSWKAGVGERAVDSRRFWGSRVKRRKRFSRFFRTPWYIGLFPRSHKFRSFFFTFYFRYWFFLLRSFKVYRRLFLEIWLFRRRKKIL